MPSGCPRIHLNLSQILTRSHSDKDDALWEPFNAEVLARSDVVLDDYEEENCASELEEEGGGEFTMGTSKWS